MKRLQRPGFLSLALLIFLLTVNEDSSAQEELRKFFKKEYGLSFLVVPEAEHAFGIGTIVQGRGKKLRVHCYATECVPAKKNLVEKGVIQQDPFPLTLQKFRVSKGVLNMLGLAFRGKKAKYINIELEDPKIDQISLHGAETIYDEYLTDSGKKLIKKGKEMVYKALHCQALRFYLLDNRENKVNLVGRDFSGSLELQSDGFTVTVRSGWVAFRSLRYHEKKGWLPSAPIERREEGIDPRRSGSIGDKPVSYIEAEEVPARSYFEGIVEVPKANPPE